jgi:hypothetical protein
MIQTSVPGPGAVETDSGARFELSPQQVAYFETFGFLRIPGLFADDIGRITDGFERIFAARPHMETHETLHLDERRLIIPGFIEHDPFLHGLLDDHRVAGTVRGLMGDEYEYCQSDGNLFYCESSWHPDTYSAPLTRYHVKLSFYLDPIDSASGAIRLIPGTNFQTSRFARTLRRGLDDPQQISEVFGVDGRDIPSWTLATDPGDLVVWNFRTIHASYNGGQRRRLFSMNFREVTAPAAA